MTEHPTTAWTRQQLREACSDDAAARFLLHDRDATFDAAFGRAVDAFGLTPVRTARVAWQNPYVARVMARSAASVWDYVRVFHERQLRRGRLAYVAYDQRSRTHVALRKEPPEARAVEPAGAGRIMPRPEVGGLHHRYQRQAA